MSHILLRAQGTRVVLSGYRTEKDRPVHPRVGAVFPPERIVAFFHKGTHGEGVLLFTFAQPVHLGERGELAHGSKKT